MDRWTVGQLNRCPDKRAVKLTDRQTDVQTYSSTDKVKGIEVIGVFFLNAPKRKIKESDYPVKNRT
jgi:hypothetical protein